MDQREIEQLLSEETLDIKKYINLVLRYWYWFAISLVTCMAIAYIVTKSTANVYELNSTILIRDDKNRTSATGAEALLSELSLVANTKSIQNEIGILKSYTIAFNTIKQLQDFHTNYTVIGKNKMRKYLLYKDTPILAIFDTTTVAPNTLLFLKFTDGKHFQVKTQNGEYNQTYSLGQKIELDKFKFTIHPTAFFNEENISDFTYAIKKNDLNELSKAYMKKVKVNMVDKNASLISLSTTGESAEQEADYLNTLIKEYIRQGLEEKNQTAQNTINFIDNQLYGMRDSLKRAEGNLRDFRMQNRILDVDKETSLLLDKMKDLQSSKATVDINQRFFNYLKDYLSKRNSYADIVAPYTLGIADTQLNDLLGELSQLSMERQNLKLSVKENNPAMIQLDTKISNLKKSLTEKVNSLIATNKLANEELKRQTDEVEERISHLPSNEQQLINKTKMYDLLDKTYSYLLEKKSEASIAKASNISDCKIVDPALAINAELKQPKPKINYVLGFILGFIIPLVVIVLRDYLDDKLRSIKDITGKLPNVPMLSTLDHASENHELPVFIRPKSRLAESFRTLRTNINYMISHNDSKVIMISSLISGEGKTFCAANLAAIFAASGKKTLLIGLDLRKPKLQLVFGQTNHKGMSSYLSNQSIFEETYKTTMVPNLYLASSGPIPPNPSELIGSRKMEEYLDNAKTEFDCIVIDTPPIGIVTDARILFNYVDLAVFVARLGVTPKDAIDFCKEIHSTINQKFGIIINDFDSKKSYSNYSKYHYRYNKNYSVDYYES